MTSERTTVTDREALVAKWRDEADRLRGAADNVRRRGSGSRQSVATQAAHSFSAATLEACANDLEALSSSASSSIERRVEDVRLSTLANAIINSAAASETQEERPDCIRAAFEAGCHARPCGDDGWIFDAPSSSQARAAAEAYAAYRAQSSPVPHEAKRDGEQ